MEQLFIKVINALSDPVNLILFIWVWWLIKDRGDLLEINAKLLDAQQQRGITLANIATMLDSRLPAGKGGGR